jgi:hypothetical protein
VEEGRKECKIESKRGRENTRRCKREEEESETTRERRERGFKRVSENARESWRIHERALQYTRRQESAKESERVQKAR